MLCLLAASSSCLLGVVEGLVLVDDAVESTDGAVSKTRFNYLLLLVARYLDKQIFHRDTFLTTGIFVCHF